MGSVAGEKRASSILYLAPNMDSLPPVNNRRILLLFTLSLGSLSPQLKKLLEEIQLGCFLSLKMSLCSSTSQLRK